VAINISDLAKEINRQLAEYAHGVGEEVEKLAQKVANDGVKKLRENSPKLTGDYKKGWRVKKVKGTYIIHNKTDYQLTHLIEKGHASASGTDRVPPIVHIAPVEEEAIKEFKQGVIEVIQR
jgi:hypothetical protein